jgi:rubredoxin
MAFEGSFLGDPAKLQPTDRLECGVCWWIYDPAKGDEVWHIPPGTPFAALPAHWRCPHCDAPQHKFMVIADD